MSFLFTLEHSPRAYRLDFALYGLISLALALALLEASPTGRGLTLTLWALGGGMGWTLVEYLLHRYVLHGVPPFSRWHAEHHSRPGALMGSPTVMSLGLFATLVAAPAWYLTGAWPACALTFGLMTGYLVYGLVHHATHHQVPGPLGRSRWLAQRRRWHAQHHLAHRVATPGTATGHYGVSSGLWDYVFGTANKR